MHGNIHAQDFKSTNEDSLIIFLGNNDLASYYKKIALLSDTAFVNSDASALLSYSHLLQQEFGNLNKAQLKEFRRTSAILGNFFYKLTGDLDETLRILLGAHEKVENKLTLDSLAWFVENPISNYYTMKGDFDRASYYSAMVKYSLKYHKRYDYLSRYYTNLGRQLNSEFKVDEAINIFNTGYALADSIGYNNGIFANAVNLAEVYNNLAKVDSAGKYLAIAGEYLPTLTSDTKYLEKKSSFKIESARYEGLQGRYILSIPLYQEGIQALRQYYPNENRREFAKYYTSLADAYLRIDSIVAGGKTIDLGFASLVPEFKEEDELPRIHQLYTENSFIDLLDLKAQLYEKEFSYTNENTFLVKALASLDLALYVNDLIRETVIADPSKLVSIRSNKELIDKGISLLYQLSIQDLNEDYYDEIRALFNRSKALLYGEKSQRNILVEIMTIEDKEKLASLQEKLLELHHEKIKQGADINALNGEILTCQEQIGNIFSSYETIALNTQVPEDYIEYFIGEDNVYSLSKLSGEMKFLKLGSQVDFQRLANRLNDFILLKGMSLDESILQEMYHFLIQPISNQLPADVIFIPDGAIGYVPFEMLRDEAGKYLLEHTTVSYVFEYITYVNDIVENEKTWDIYCLAPQYKMKEGKGNGITRGSVYHLPYAKIEVDSIKNLYEASALTSQSANKEEWQHNISDCRIFHYAGHAIIEGDKAYLAFTSNEDEKEQLTAGEIALMHQPLDLVVLSACETGLGKLEQGEGIRSLGRNFMEAGAESTIISLWNVNDKSTALIMTSFYKYLRSGMNKDTALRQSKLDYLKNASARNAHPYFWAAFIPAGDMRALKN